MGSSFCFLAVCGALIPRLGKGQKMYQKNRDFRLILLPIHAIVDILYQNSILCLGSFDTFKSKTPPKYEFTIFSIYDIILLKGDYMDYIEITKRDIEIEKTILQNYKKELKNLPKGYLICNRKESGEYYYHVVNNKRKYIRKEKYHLIQKLKRKKQLQVSIDIIEKNIIIQSKMLENYRRYEFGMVENTLPMSYKETKVFNNQALHQTSCGLKVRSKSEVTIVEALIARKIEFVYEKRVELHKNGKIIVLHPDFAFKTRYGIWVYWEHFGMLGSDSYKETAMNKIETYIENSLFPSRDFFITCDSNDGALDMVSIMNTIDLIEKLL